MNLFHKKNRIQLIPIALVSFMMASLCLPSCLEEPKISKREFKKLVDTLYLYEVTELNAELDSLCDLNTDSMIQANVDSIMKIRLEQIEKLIQN